MKKILTLLFALTFLFGFFSINAALAGEKPVVAYSSVGDPNPWFIAFSKEMDKEAAKRGYQYKVAHAQAKIEKQLADVEDIVAQKPDILVLGPVDVQGSAECLPVAKKAGVPVLVVNRDILGTPGKDYITRIYSDFEWIGAKQCEVIYEAFGSDQQINVVELHGTPGGGNTIGLSKGFRKQMEKYPNMKIVSSQLGDYNRSTALKSMENIVQSGIKFNAVFGHFDEEGIAAVQALKAADKKIGSNPAAGEIVIVSNGGIKDALKAIEAGDMHATVTVSPYYANQVFDAIEAFSRGESLPDYIRVDDFVIDKSNVEQHKAFGF